MTGQAYARVARRRGIRRASQRRGTSFVELLFSVALLGIGFIMLAAMFPVAIQQTERSMDDSNGVMIAANVEAVLGSTLRDQDVANLGAGALQPFWTDALLWDRVGGESIHATDPRYGWVGLYRRNGRLADVVVFVVRSRSRGGYAMTDLVQATEDVSGLGPGLGARGVDVTLEDGGRQADRIKFGGLGAAAVVEGAFVVISSDGGDGTSIGRIFRVGPPVDAADNLWTLAPGYDLAGPRDDLTLAGAYVVGREYVDPSRPELGFEGPAQDVAVFRMTVRLR